jgi:DNA-binding IclR family transcriptional regulator
MNVTNTSVMTEWCRILELLLAHLKSKDWVAVGDAIEQMELTKETGMNVLNFLSEFNFIEFDTSKEKIRITNQSLRLLTMPDR